MSSMRWMRKHRPWSSTTSAIGARPIAHCNVFARDEAVTIRERDSMEQVRVPIAGLVAALRDRLEAA